MLNVVKQDQYLLGYKSSEQGRLQHQAQMLADEARWLFDRTALSAGARVVEVGCGPRGTLDLLSERVGPTGTVVGVERGEEAVRLARQFAADRKLANVKVFHGDGRATGLPRGMYDLATARLVLVNVPHPEEIVAELAALVRPGGTVALYEADWLGVVCDPPLNAWNRLAELVHSYASRNGIDMFVGRKIARLLREAGLVDVQWDPVIHAAPQGHAHRALLLTFVENLRERLFEQKLVADDELQRLINAVKRHIDDPHTLVVGGIFFRAWGCRPMQQSVNGHKVNGSAARAVAASWFGTTPE
jgi:SAM-dependent methyltransferase